MFRKNLRPGLYLLSQRGQGQTWVVVCLIGEGQESGKSPKPALPDSNFSAPCYTPRLLIREEAYEAKSDRESSTAGRLVPSHRSSAARLDSNRKGGRRTSPSSSPRTRPAERNERGPGAAAGAFRRPTSEISFLPPKTQQQCVPTGPPPSP